MKKKTNLLFPVTDKDLRVEYPELNAVEEFKNLTRLEMEFVWHFANKSSKVCELPERDRAIKCLVIMKGELSAETLKEYSELKFPDHIQGAVERMSKYDPEIRTQAKVIAEKIFENINKIVNMEITEKTDMEDKQKYVSLSINIMKNLPDMVSQREHGYGIRTEGQKKETSNSGGDENLWDSSGA